MTSAPITVWCEGSGCPPAFESIPMCPMCGQFPQLRSDGTMTGHHRRDLLAEIERGDFDAHIDGKVCG